MRAFLVSLLLVSVLTANASNLEKKVAKRGFYQPQQHVPVHIGGSFVQGHGHGNNHGLDLGHGFGHGHGGYVQGIGHGLSLGYGNGHGYDHHRQLDNVANHVVKVSVPVVRPIAQPAFVPGPVHVSRPVVGPVFVPESNHGHSAVGASYGLPLLHKHIPFKSNFGGFESSSSSHGSAGLVGHFNGNLGEHVGSSSLTLPSTSYGEPVGPAVIVSKPTDSYGNPSEPYDVSATTGTDHFSNGHGAGSFGASLSVASSSAHDDGYSYPVPAKKFF